MKRWHDERDLMIRRWRLEVAKHENLPDESLAVVPPDGDACHCYRGMGTMRKVRPYGCRLPRCGLCHPGKKWPKHTRSQELRAAIEYELAAA